MGIRWRLTLWNLLALAVVLIGTAAVVYGVLRHVLYSHIDHILKDEFDELQSDPHLASSGRERLRYWIAEFKEHENILAVTYGPNGSVYERTTELASSSLPFIDQKPTTQETFNTLDLALIGKQRLLWHGLKLEGAEYLLVLMAPLSEADHELERLATVLFTVIPIALVAAAAVSYLLAWKALRPVDQMRQLTQQITAERLNQRLPVSDARDELSGLAQTINAMIGRLEHSFAEIRRFTADASHELRTPLTAIRTEAEVALKKGLELGESERLLASILEECERLTRLTDQLLMLSREDTGTTQKQEAIDLTVLAKSVAETMRPVADARQLRLEMDGKLDFKVHGDSSRLRQVIFNLLDNAIKYTPPGGKVKLHTEQRNETAVLTVSDTGIGIPAEHLPHVFKRFYRVDQARSRTEGGTGLGLSIVESIVRANGGTVELESQPDQGTIVTVTLPLVTDE